MNTTAAEINEVPFLRNIGLITTYRCQIACSHCIVKAGPNRRKETALKDIHDWIQQIAIYRNNFIKSLSLTGGEPFYDAERLKKILSYGEAHNLVITVVTNAYWANSLEDALNMLRTLPAIKMLAVSTDTHHQKFIPLQNIENAIQAANRCHLPYEIKVCTDNENSLEYKTLLNRLHAIAKADSIGTALTLPLGRALKAKFDFQFSDAPPSFACSSASSPVIFPDGTVVACCGALIDIQTVHPLILGNLRENSLQEILDKAELNPILHAIRIWGPAILVSEINKAGLAKYLPKKYVRDSICHACHDLLSNPILVEFLSQLAQDNKFKRRVSYARLYYLNEAKFVENLQKETLKD